MAKSILPKVFLSEKNLHSFAKLNSMHASDHEDDIACLTNDTKRIAIFPHSVCEPRLVQPLNSVAHIFLKSSFKARFCVWLPLVNSLKS